MWHFQQEKKIEKKTLQSNEKTGLMKLFQ